MQGAASLPCAHFQFFFFNLPATWSDIFDKSVSQGAILPCFAYALQQSDFEGGGELKETAMV